MTCATLGGGGMAKVQRSTLEGTQQTKSVLSSVEPSQKVYDIGRFGCSYWKRGVCQCYNIENCGSDFE